MKIAFLFPGQGAQKIGMCKDIYDNFEEARDIYKRASKILGKDIAKLCFESTDEELNKTSNTQIAILVSSLAICNVLKKYNISPDVCAGLSLGEYTALIDGGYLSFEEGLKLVQKRGEIMQECNSNEYMMAAVIGLESSAVEQVCKSIEGFVVPANYNYSMQTVISGDKNAVELASSALKEKGAKRVIPLNTAGPFHTFKLKDASDKLKLELEKIHFRKGEIPVLKNLDGLEYKDNEDFVDILSEHMINPVRMDKILKNLKDRDIELYVEVGPGKALGGFVKKENKESKAISVENMDTLNKLLELVKE